MSKVQTDQPSQAMLNKINPKRVEAGKRLATISKQAKEAKRLEREAQQDATTKEWGWISCISSAD